jgi:hypothetical protein
LGMIVIRCIWSMCSAMMLGYKRETHLFRKEPGTTSSSSRRDGA